MIDKTSELLLDSRGLGSSSAWSSAHETKVGAAHTQSQHKPKMEEYHAVRAPHLITLSREVPSSIEIALCSDEPSKYR